MIFLHMGLTLRIVVFFMEVLYVAVKMNQLLCINDGYD